jgi:hypothetical protein
MTALPAVPRVLAPIVFVLMLVPGTAMAQTPSVPRADLFGGASFFNEDGSTFTGAQFAGAYRTGKHFGVVGDIAFYQERTTLMGGVRVHGTAPKFTVFGQFLVGSAPLDDIAFQPGLGVDIHLGSRAAIRAAFDIKLSGDEGFYVGTRFSTGLVINLGRQ